MPNTILPTQIGYTPKSDLYVSQVVIGKDITASFEAVGFGAQARPDELSKLRIYLTDQSVTPNKQLGSFVLDVADLQALKTENDNVPQPLTFTLKEVAICELVDGSDTIEKRAVVLMSQTYLPSD